MDDEIDKEEVEAGLEEVEGDGEEPSMTILKTWGYSWEFLVGWPAARFSKS